MTKLSVNINKIATLRNARGGNVPDVVEAARRIEQFGADGITVHPRPDERHIRRGDVYQLKQVVTTEFNIEGYPSADFLAMVLEVKPHQVTLVPDPPEAITSNAGWDVLAHQEFLAGIVAQLQASGIRHWHLVSQWSRILICKSGRTRPTLDNNKKCLSNAISPMYFTNG
jgi:pyridoxine 5-phosphate synthase